MKQRSYKVLDRDSAWCVVKYCNIEIEIRRIVGKSLLKNRPIRNPKKLNLKSKSDCGAEQTELMLVKNQIPYKLGPKGESKTGQIVEHNAKS